MTIETLPTLAELDARIAAGEHVDPELYRAARAEAAAAVEDAALADRIVAGRIGLERATAYAAALEQHAALVDEETQALRQLVATLDNHRAAVASAAAAAKAWGERRQERYQLTGILGLEEARGGIPASTLRDFDSVLVSHVVEVLKGARLDGRAVTSSGGLAYTGARAEAHLRKLLQ